jgi:thymidylate synthase (FAD)
MVFVEPMEWLKFGTRMQDFFLIECRSAEYNYKDRIEFGDRDYARGCLPLDIKSSDVITANVAEWRHIFKQRCTKRAHPHIRFLMTKLRDEFAEKLPVLFGDLKEN